MLKFYLVFLISACSVLNTFAEIDTDDAIKLPEPTESEDDNVPDECKNKTYCTIKPKNYPQEVFDELYKGYKNNSRNFIPQPVSFLSRQGDPLAMDDCTKVVTLDPLYLVRTSTSSSWRTVVQSPEEDFIQRFRLETCYDQDVSCFKVVTSESYTNRCIQNYMTWQVLVASEHNAGKTEKILIDLPMYCSCGYKPMDVLIIEAIRFREPTKSEDDVPDNTTTTIKPNNYTNLNDSSSRLA